MYFFIFFFVAVSFYSCLFINNFAVVIGLSCTDFIIKGLIFIEKKHRKVWRCQKYVVPLHSQFRNESIANEYATGCSAAR